MHALPSGSCRGSWRISSRARAQVYFVGSDAKIDMRPSSVWLREKTAKWPWATHLRVGAKRDEALEILSSEGTLLVLCSLVDNMPYVVAEAAVRAACFLPGYAHPLPHAGSTREHCLTLACGRASCCSAAAHPAGMRHWLAPPAPRGSSQAGMRPGTRLIGAACAC